MDEALIRTYNSKGITHDNASLEDPANPGYYREMPVLGDLYEILKAAPETTRMAPYPQPSGEWLRQYL